MDEDTTCETPVLGANIVPGETSPLVGMIQPYTIVENPDGGALGRYIDFVLLPIVLYQ